MTFYNNNFRFLFTACFIQEDADGDEFSMGEET